MVFATIMTFFIAFLLLKKKKIKEFFLFLVVLLIFYFPSLETFIETNIHLPIKNMLQFNSEVSKNLFASLPSVIKLFYLFSSITIACFILNYSIRLFLEYKKNQFSDIPAKQSFSKSNQLKKNLFTFQKPNMKISA